MRFAIVGAGAMGCVFGGQLRLAGHEVVLVDIREDHVGAIREHGLELRRPGGETSVVRIDATTDPTSVHPVDVAIFLTKGFATRAAAQAVRAAIRGDSWVVTVQNGLGNERVLGEVLNPAQVVPGTTTVGAMSDGPGVVTMSAGTAERQSLTHLGPPRTATDVPEGVSQVAQVLTAAGLPTQALASADVVIWTKLALAASMAPLTAILRRSVKDVMDDEHARGLLHDMVAEIIAVALASGVALDAQGVWAHAEKTYASVDHHVTSMAADVVAGRRTEIETMALEVARLGAGLGVATPVTSTVGRLVRSLEGSYERAL